MAQIEKLGSVVLVFGMSARRIGGIEVHTRELVRRLELRGRNVVLCFHQSPAPLVRQFLSLPNVIWEDLPYAWCNSWQASRDLFRILRRYRPCLLHLQFTPSLSLNPWIACLAGVPKIVFTDHHSYSENDQPQRRPFWIRFLGRLLNCPVSVIVGVSEFKKKIIAALGTFPPERVRRVYNGVSLELGGERSEPGIAFRERYRIPPEKILITQISQMTPVKGISHLLEAAQLALSQNPNLHFAFVGDGEHLQQYTKKSVDLGIADNVTWTGLVSNPMVDGVFAASDIVCLASLWQEAFGFVIAEAMACEKPVVATGVGGIPELVDDGKTGFVVPPRDPAVMAEKFILLAQDRALRLRLGLAGRQRAAALFDVRKNVDQLLELYGEL